jgi:hypothetical protein
MITLRAARLFRRRPTSDRWPRFLPKRGLHTRANPKFHKVSGSEGARETALEQVYRFGESITGPIQVSLDFNQADLRCEWGLAGRYRCKPFAGESSECGNESHFNDSLVDENYFPYTYEIADANRILFSCLGMPSWKKKLPKRPMPTQLS